jgi:hypothetical protein
MGGLETKCFFIRPAVETVQRIYHKNNLDQVEVIVIRIVTVRLASELDDLWLDRRDSLDG